MGDKDRRRAATVALWVGLLTTGCGTAGGTDDDPTSEAGAASARPSPTDSLTEESADASDQAGPDDPTVWEPVRDPGGFRFELPSAPEPQTTQVPGPTGAEVEARSYSAETADDTGVSVAVVDQPVPTGPSGPRLARATMRSTLDQLERRLGTEAPDATVSDVRSTRVAGWPAVTARFGFTASEGYLSRWRLLTVWTDQAQLSLQTIRFDRPRATGAPAILDRAYEQFVDALVVPPA